MSEQKREPQTPEQLKARLYAALKHEKSCTCGECSGGLNAVDDLLALLAEAQQERDEARRDWQMYQHEVADETARAEAGEREVERLTNVLEYTQMRADAQQERAEAAERRTSELDAMLVVAEQHTRHWERLAEQRGEALRKISAVRLDGRRRDPCHAARIAMQTIARAALADGGQQKGPDA